MRTLGIAVAVAATLAAGAAEAAGTSGAKLRIVDLTPVTVQGARFRAGERVRVVLRADRSHVRIVRAGRAGTFFARFGGVYAELCMALQLRATGASGAVAVATRKPPPSCAALDPVP